MNKEVEPTVEPEKEIIPEEPVSSVPEVSSEEVAVKPKVKRCRELDALQEDLKTSWICEGAMRATGSRTSSQKNKSQDQTHEPTASTEEESAASAKSTG